MIATRYEILGPLGAGGMGAVFKAHDRALDETVALKVLRLAGEGSSDLATRFRSEIKLAWKVRHRNVCGIHEYGQDGDLLFISMELVEGRDLKTILQEDGPPDWEEAYGVALEVAEGLQAIHEAGVIHRDLKPANIMRDATGLVRLMDFGIAKVRGDASEPGLTRAGQVVGSPEYMSPEQIRGRRIDVRSDLYALGVVVYEIFTGRIPFPAETPVEAMMKHLEEEPPFEGPEASRLPAALVPVLRKALAKDPEQRFASCRELVGALQSARGALESQFTDALGNPPASAGPPVPRDEDEDEDAPTRIVPELRPTRPSPHARLLVPALLRGLRHPEPAVRVGAARALGNVGVQARAAVEELTRAQDDADARVRQEAAAALAKIEPPESEAIVEVVAKARDRAAPAPAPPPAASASPAPTSLPPARPSPLPVWSTMTADRPGPAPSAVLRPARAQRLERRTWPSLKLLLPPTRSGPGAAVAVAVLALGGAAGLAFWAWGSGRRPMPATRLPTPLAQASTPADGPPSPLQPGAPEPIRPEPEPRQPAAAPSRPPAESTKLSPAHATPAAPPEQQSRAASALAGGPAPVATPPTPGAMPAASLTTPNAEAPPPPAASAAPPAPSPSLVPPAPRPTLPSRGPFELDAPGVVAPICDRCPAPAYPPVAERRGVQGTVELRVLVDERGAVVGAEVVKGADLLTEAALRGVRRWTYRPGSLGGRPVAVWVPVSVRFAQQ